MTALPAQSAPAPRRAPAPKPERRLRPAPEPGGRAKPRLAYAIIALGGVAVIVVVQLLLSIAVAQGAYEIDGLPPGDYAVEASADRFQAASRDVTVEPGRGQTVSFATLGRPLNTASVGFLQSNANTTVGMTVQFKEDAV